MNFFKALFFCVTFSALGQIHFVQFEQDRLQFEHQFSTNKVLLHFEIAPGYHIQDHENVSDNLIPTEIRIAKPQGISVEHINFKIRSYESLQLGNETHRVISGSFIIEVEYKKDNSTILEATLLYQACDDIKCFFPRELSFVVPLE